MNIKVLGPGCANCKTLERRTLDAVRELNLTATVQKVVDLEKMSAYGIFRTPGLVIDETLVSQGGVPTVEKIKELLTAHKGST